LTLPDGGRLQRTQTPGLWTKTSPYEPIYTLRAGTAQPPS
ncbi:hypothetical protein C358_05638, partial [Cryptococcus neoformans MW-RSA852]